MAPAYTVYAYEDASGRSPYREWLTELLKSNPKAAAKAQWLIELLAMNGTELKPPYAKPVNGPILELRGRTGHDPVRVYYFRCSAKAFMVVCGEVKKQNTPSPKLIALALRAHAEHQKQST